MGYRRDVPTTDEYYHVFNRGVEKRVTFVDTGDYFRFLEMLAYYNCTTPLTSFSKRRHFSQDSHKGHDWGPPLVEIIAYCIMPNHYHLILRQLVDNGIPTFLRRVSDAYTKAFNTRWRRVGPLFQGPYKLVHISNNIQLLHLSRYLHLNPVVAKLLLQADRYPWSSYSSYLGETKPFISPSIILDQFQSPEGYRQFVEDYQDYAQSLARIKDLLIDGEE